MVTARSYQIVGRPYQMVNELVQGKRAIIPDMAIILGTVFGTGPDIWMRREADYQLRRESVRHRSRRTQGQVV